MANPTPYERGYSFTQYQVDHQQTPIPGPELDAEFEDIELSLNATITALADVRRSDGALNNGIVGPDQLSPALSLGFTLRGTWTDGTLYNTGDGVAYGNKLYSARLSHTASAATRPDLSPATWTMLFDSTAVVIADGSITAAKLASDAVTTVKILDANVTAAKLASNAVTAAKILDTNVTTAKLADGAVTALKQTGLGVLAATQTWAGVNTFAGLKLNASAPDVGEIRQVILTGSGNYAKPTGVRFVRVQMWGAGGGGGGAPINAAGNASVGSGGGGGGYVEHLYANADLAASEAYVVGQGTAGGAGAGTAGGNTTFKGLTAGGGAGGASGTTGTSVSQTTSSAGGSASGGNVWNIAGGPGGSGCRNDPVVGIARRGAGGTAPFVGVVPTTIPLAAGAGLVGDAGAFPGGGAGGAGAGAGGAAANGGTPAHGSIIITEFY